VGVNTIKHLSFSNGGIRHYKGEGELNFMCYFPFAISEYSILPDAHKNAAWAAASRIPDKLENVYPRNNFTATTNGFQSSFYIYNAGDSDMLLTLTLKLP
jgi:hypothetical protein